MVKGRERVYSMNMATITARVHDGRLLLDTPTDLPEGTEVELIPVDAWDELDEEDWAELESELAEAELEAEAGKLIDAGEVLAGLWRKRG